MTLLQSHKRYLIHKYITTISVLRQDQMARSLRHKNMSHITLFKIICNTSEALHSIFAPRQHSKHGKSMPHRQNWWCFKM